MFGVALTAMSMFMAAGASGQAATRTTRTSKVNAALSRAETAEESRRLLGDIQESEGLMSAISAGSGVQVSGSRELAIQKVRKENIAQFDWLQESGKQKQKAILRGGQFQASQLKSQAASQTLSGFSQIAQGLYSNYGNTSKGT
jgi:hypothetical protein